MTDERKEADAASAAARVAVSTKAKRVAKAKSAGTSGSSLPAPSYGGMAAGIPMSIGEQADYMLEFLEKESN